MIYKLLKLCEKLWPPGEGRHHSITLRDEVPKYSKERLTLALWIDGEMQTFFLTEDEIFKEDPDLLVETIRGLIQNAKEKQKVTS